jgi:hypothetical protein
LIELRWVGRSADEIGQNVSRNLIGAPPTRAHVA